jgi:hypothetical protein
METKNGGQQDHRRSYEVTPDGRVKVNISKLLESPKVREFYRSIRQMTVEKAPKGEA